MPRAIVATAFLAAAFALQTAPAFADDQIQKLRDAIVSANGDNFRADQLAASVSRLFESIDRNRDGIERDEIELFGQKLKAELRSQIVAQYLQYDLNGDFEITSEEVIAKTVPDRGETEGLASNTIKRRYDEAVSRILVDDKNGDGRISLEELKAVNLDDRGRGGRRSLGQVNLAEALLAFDRDGDGKLTQIEAFAAVADAFAGVDPKSFEKKRQADGSGTLNAACRAPQAAADSKIILLGAYEGESLSTVSVAGQDKATSAGTLTIEPGKQPLDLLLTSNDPMIWRIEGDAARVAHVVVASMSSDRANGKSSAGVVGVPKDRVTFIPGRRCLRAFHDARTQGIASMERVQSLVGRRPDKLIGIYGLYKLQLPSGVETKPPKTGTQQAAVGDGAVGRLEMAFNQYYPGGVQQIALKDVISDATVQDYRVLPSEAGLLGLIKDGTLEVVDVDDFKIARKMRYPGDLTRSSRLRFTLKTGVPEPEGNPGAACVFLEQGGRLIEGGSHCRLSVQP